MTAQEHNKLLSVFFFIQAGLSVLGGILVAFMYGGMGAFLALSGGRDEQQYVGGIIVIVGLIVGLVVLALSGFYAFSGWKLHKTEPIARTLGIICSVLFLFGFPLGTMLGIYGLWFLLSDEGKAFYSENRHPAEYSGSPGPESWK